MPTRDSSHLSRRSVLKASLAAGVLAAAARPSAAAPKKTRPNILLLMGDQHRGDCVGADGNKAAHTPNLDRLAAEGAIFRCAYSSTPSCSPARACLLTGLSPWNHGMLGYATVAERYPRELPRLMVAQGYHAVGIGKMHYHPQRNTHGFHKTLLDESGRVESPGFVSDYRQWFASVAPGQDPDATGIGWNSHRAAPYALDEHLHPTIWTAEEAVKFLQTYQEDSPFLLKVSFARPHSPYDPPQRWWDHFAKADLPARAIGDWAQRHAQLGKKHADDLWQGDLGEEVARRSRQGYYGSVAFVDEQIGRVLAALEKRGGLENTLILYTSDHGDMTGDHHLWRKTYGYEPSARVPMLVRWGDSFLSAQRGQSIRNPVELRDILPTLLDAAAAEFDPRQFDGRSLLDLLRGKAQGWRPWIDLEHSTCYARENAWTGLSDGRIKYIYYAPDGRQQLFDLHDDPQETKDLSASPAHQDLLRTWRIRMVDHLAVRGEPFVSGGDLAIRTQPIVYSPNYPKNVKPA